MGELDYAYQYDGTFAGFLTCVSESLQRGERPVFFLAPGDGRITLYPQRTVETRRERALAVYRELARRISPEARRLASFGFLTCLPERERVIWTFIRLGLDVGAGVVHRRTDDRVGLLQRAVEGLTGEAHQYKGFVRFSDFGGLLAGEIEPKNRVLPLLRPHFCSRFPHETFLLYDRTHGEGLFHRPGQWTIAPVEAFQMAPPGQRERDCRRLWKTFYDAIAIAQRENPRCRMTHMPKRYWSCMTEFQEAPSGRTPG